MLFDDKNYRKTTFFSIIIAILLIIFGILYSMAYSLKTSKSYLETLFDRENGLNTIVEYVAFDGKNAYAIASRYVEKDDLVLKELWKTSEALLGNNLSINKKSELFYSLNDNIFPRMHKKLSSIPSFLSSNKDKVYWDTLALEINNLTNSSVINEYNISVAEFNAKLIKFPNDVLSFILNYKPFDYFK